VLQQLYGGDKDLDKQDIFLRNFIFSEGWKNKGQNLEEDNYYEYQQKNEKVDQEDEDRDLEMDQYEYTHNFRYEDKNAAYLTTYAREAPEDSMRRVEDKRKTQRQTAQEKKEADKLKRKEEINKLKALKRQEIADQLKQTEFIAGTDIRENKKLLEKVEKELQTEFIPDLYYKNMDAIFDDKYYNASDADS